MKVDLYRKEAHYGWTACAIVVIYVLFMSYLFPKDWAETSNSLVFIERMANIIPALNNLMHHSSEYTNFWGMFYAIFWMISPSFFILGFISTFFLPDAKYKRMILASHRLFLAGFWLFVMVFIYIWAFPFLGGIISPFISQISNFIMFRLAAWGVTTGAIYSVGSVFGAFYLRFKLSRKI